MDSLISERMRLFFWGFLPKPCKLIQAVRLFIFSNLDRPYVYLGHLICTDIRARPNLIVEIICLAEKSAIDSRSSGQMTHQGNTVTQERAKTHIFADRSM